MTDAEILDFAQALGAAVDAEVARRPGVTTLELCGVLGGLAGVVLGQAVPTASAEVDDVHRDAVAGSFRMALLEARERGRAVN
ncbi:hypothetical protein [Lichenibacterium dinghuense]|uniref:hypothetical protein n=1 Tax=Lichenibacterium dinghuense TaxID=2895977 RepID=UPI001F356338|nr:hypothetical protein [Lichenibacterium sp. 6Y81]